MSNLNTKTYNKKILDLWKEQADGITELMPVFYPDLQKKAILFIGLNPSFNVSGIKNNLADSDDLRDIDPKKDLSLENLSESVIDTLSYMHKKAKENYFYFNRFKEIADETDLQWEHIDLFFTRITSQNALKAAKEKAPEFFERQLQLSLQLLKDLEPAIVVVENAYARELLKDKLKIQSFDQNIGTYRLPDNTPLFFSGMLTGQRALDTGSFERLKWHIKFVMNKEGISA